MEVEGVNSQVLPTIQSGTALYTEQTVEETAQEQPQSSGTPELEATEQEENNSGEIKGVIRNLLDGHFKGVADVRLRINHFEQLAEIEGENLKATAEEEVANMLDAIDSGIDNLFGSDELFTTEVVSEDKTATVMELHHEFGDTVNELKGEFQSAQTPSTDNLINGIEDAFAVFIEALQNLLAPTAEEDSSMDEENLQSESLSEGVESNVIAEELTTEQEDELTNEIVVTTANEAQEPTIVVTGSQISSEPTETVPTLTDVEAQIISEPEPPSVETPTDDGPQATVPTEPNYQGLIDELENAFATAIAELTEALNVTQVLPELSEPSGNGVAYEKFLAIYNEMWAIGADEDNTASSGNIDMMT